MARLFTENDMIAALRHAYTRGRSGTMLFEDGAGRELDPGVALLDELDRLSASEQTVIAEHAHRFEVPADEPAFVLRASDIAALTALQSYRHWSMVSDAPVEHVRAADDALDSFRDFRFNHHKRMAA